MRQLLDNIIVRSGLLALAVAAVGFNFDPVLLLIEGIPVLPGVGIACLAGFLGYHLLNTGSEDVVEQATGLVVENAWPEAIVPGIIAFGTSLSELGFVIVSTINGQTEVLAHSIISSDGFQLGVLFFGCVIVARSTSWRPGLLRNDMILLTLMSFFVLSGVHNGFTRFNGALIVISALLAAWQFMADTPDDVHQEMPDVVANSSVLTLLTGFGCLLLGTVWFYDAIMFTGTVIGAPAFLIGTAAAVISSAGEIFTSLPLVKRGEKGLAYACIALAGSNAFDTSFLGLSILIRPFEIAPVAHNIVPAAVTCGLTALVMFFVHRPAIPRWVGWIVVPSYIASFIILMIAGS